MADNYSINIHSDKELVLDNAIRIAFAHNGSNSKVRSYCIHPDWGLVYFWTENPKFSKDYDSIKTTGDGWDVDQAINFALNWLENEKQQHYRNFEPLFKKVHEFDPDEVKGWHESKFNENVCGSYDGDVINEMGFHFTTGNSWGQIAGNFYTICAITPSYTWYGK